MPVWKKLLYGNLTAVFLLGGAFLLFELILFAFGVRPIFDERDPAAGYAQGVPLFEERERDGKTVMVTARNKLGLFNRQEFPKNKASDSYRIFCLGGVLLPNGPAKDPQTRWTEFTLGIFGTNPLSLEQH